MPSLQGSLGTVDLPEVLGLLVATAMSGELFVAGDRTRALARVPSVHGRLWFDAGHLVAADVAGERDLVSALVALLWLVEGTFTFEPGQPPSGGAGAEIAEVLREALAAHGEWQEIERVLPSQQAWLELNADPPPRRVTLTPEQWRLVAAVGGGGSVGGVVARFGADDLPGCRAVKEIVESGLVTVRPSHADEQAVAEDRPGGRERVEAGPPSARRGVPTISMRERASR